MSLAAMYMEWRLESRGEPVSGYVRGMTDLGTLGGPHQHHHELAAYCHHCDRSHLLDLAQLVATGHGPRGLPIRVHCLICSEVGQLQARPPVPTRGSGGWMDAR